jgi:hypothetical protein
MSTFQKLDTGGTIQGIENTSLIRATLRSTGNHGAASYLSYTPITNAGLYIFYVSINVTAWTTPASFTATLVYNDSGGTTQTETIGFVKSVGTPAQAVATVDRYYGIPMIFTAQTSHAIVMATTGTFTGSPTYDVLATLTETLVQ